MISIRHLTLLAFAAATLISAPFSEARLLKRDDDDHDDDDGVSPNVCRDLCLYLEERFPDENDFQGCMPICTTCRSGNPSFSICDCKIGDYYNVTGLDRETFQYGQCVAAGGLCNYVGIFCE